MASGPALSHPRQRVTYLDSGRYFRIARAYSLNGCVCGGGAVRRVTGRKARLGETGPTVKGPFKEFGLYPEVSGVLLQDFKRRNIVKLGV